MTQMDRPSVAPLTGPSLPPAVGAAFVSVVAFLTVGLAAALYVGIAAFLGWATGVLHERYHRGARLDALEATVAALKDEARNEKVSMAVFQALAEHQSLAELVDFIAMNCGSVDDESIALHQRAKAAAVQLDREGGGPR